MGGNQKDADIWGQIVGKIRHGLPPLPRNHCGNVHAITLTVLGLTTRRMALDQGVKLRLDSNFIEHRLVVRRRGRWSSRSRSVERALVAAFDETACNPARLGIDSQISRRVGLPTDDHSGR